MVQTAKSSINVFEDYTKFVEKCDYENKQLIVLGDMNCDYILKIHPLNHILKD
jgi:hypothetical protein